jgi:coproporphyrinogen III oxidase
LAYKQACLNLEGISKEDIINQLEHNIQDEYFIWKDEHFYLITDGELNGEGGYLFRDINIYHPIALDKVVSQSTLDQLYDRMIEAERIFINRIEALLEAQKKGAEVV